MQGGQNLASALRSVSRVDRSEPARQRGQQQHLPPDLTDDIQVRPGVRMGAAPTLRSSRLAGLTSQWTRPAASDCRITLASTVSPIPRAQVARPPHRTHGPLADRLDQPHSTGDDRAHACPPRAASRRRAASAECGAASAACLSSAEDASPRSISTAPSRAGARCVALLSREETVDFITSMSASRVSTSSLVPAAACWARSSSCSSRWATTGLAILTR